MKILRRTGLAELSGPELGAFGRGGGKEYVTVYTISFI